MSVLIVAVLIFIFPVVLFFLNIIRNENSRLGKAIHYIYISYFSILLVCILGGVVFFPIKDAVTASKERKNAEAQEQYSLAYSSGYDDALHGIRPDIENIKCYSCGSTFYDDISFYEFNSLYVPICESCVDAHDIANPLYICGEAYYFAPAVASTNGASDNLS